MSIELIRKKLPASLSLERGMFVATINTDTIDRDSEVVVPQGMNSKQFERNPIVFYNHDHTLPVGKVVALERMAGAIKATVQLLMRPAEYIGEFFPDFVRACIEQGVVKGVSIGFSRINGGGRQATKADAEKYGDDVRYVTSKWELLELSVAPLMANPDALIHAVGKTFSNSTVKRWTGIDIVSPSPKKRVMVIETPSDEVIIAGKIGRQVENEMARRMGRIYMPN